jgi:hypothetical protein
MVLQRPWLETNIVVDHQEVFARRQEQEQIPVASYVTRSEGKLEILAIEAPILVCTTERGCLGAAEMTRIVSFPALPGDHRLVRIRVGGFP